MSLDRLSRKREDIKNEIAWFKEHKVRLMIRKRQREGIETARKISSTSFYRQARK
ncbi:hypothetical protein [Blautia wexlerae]|uniref:hypothetical protein n=1 Tax=Blautia wexlerae TaxID=418240 RepID=UPI000A551AA2|nr:hypothetical protein [Blautia wexlerae]MCB5709315.1 hypothetical protein [Blautia wexlerae]NSF90801.1 hypothetical protein [Blautia wexlerae]NSF95032.1 hypothetical protein [Blautia wexlerae]NSF98546.1 hypothetical protein [Blautia wexlerae]NSG09216.1 hypothetical protein [Blautia wexlerae]